MSDFNVLYIINIVNSVLTIALLAFVYTYLTNLESKGCECSNSPNSNFIKGFTLFAIIYLIFTMIIPDGMIKENFGSSFVIFKKFVDLIFYIVFAYYLYVVFQYTRFLVNEKCKCSADIRREIIMIGSLIEFALIFILFIFHFIIAVGLSVVFTIIRELNDSTDNIRGVIKDPIGSLSKIPSTIKKDIGEISSYVSKTKKELSKIGSKKSLKSK
jgi:hypothetical protein